MTFTSLGSNFGAVFEVNPHQSATTYSHTYFDEGPRTHDYKWSGITCWLVSGRRLLVSCGGPALDMLLFCNGRSQDCRSHSE